DDADVIVLVDVLAAERMPVADLRIRRAAQRRGAALFTIGAAQPEYRVPYTAIPVLPGETETVLRQAARRLAALAEAAGGQGKSGAAAEPDASGVERAAAERDQAVQALAQSLAGGRKAVVVFSGE